MVPDIVNVIGVGVGLYGVALGVAEVGVMVSTQVCCGSMSPHAVLGVALDTIVGLAGAKFCGVKVTLLAVAVALVLVMVTSNRRGRYNRIFVSAGRRRYNR